MNIIKKLMNKKKENDEPMVPTRLTLEELNILNLCVRRATVTVEEAPKLITLANKLSVMASEIKE